MSSTDNESASKNQASHVEDTVAIGDEHNPDSSYWGSFRFLGTVTAIVLMANSLFVGYSMPVNILSVIDADIGPSPNIYLVTLTFTLVSGVLLLIIGRLGDIIGRRYFIIGAQLFAVVGSIICATAKNVNTVVAGTVLTGIAGGGQQLYNLLVQEIVPNKYRIHSQAAITISVVPTIGFGPAIARSFVANTTLGWRWCYWLNVIVSGLSVILFAICYFPPNFQMINEQKTKLQQLKELDYGGLFLYCCGLILVMLGFTWGQGQYPWKSAEVISTVVIGFALIAAFGLYEIYANPRQPLMPAKLFKIRNFVAVLVVGCVGQMVYYCLNALWPIAITTFYTKDNITVGLLSSTTGTSLAVGEIIIAPFFKFLGRPNIQLAVASILLAVCSALMSLLDPTKRDVGIALTIIAGVGVGWVEAVAIVISGLVVPPEDIGAGLGFFASMRAVTGTIALSIYVSIYTVKLSYFMTRDVTSAATKAGLPQSSLSDLFSAISNGTTSALNNVPGMNDAVAAAVDRGTKLAYKHAFRVVYLSTLAFGILAIISAFFVQDVSHFLTGYVNKTIHDPNAKDSEKVDANTDEKV